MFVCVCVCVCVCVYLCGGGVLCYMRGFMFLKHSSDVFFCGSKASTVTEMVSFEGEQSSHAGDDDHG